MGFFGSIGDFLSGKQRFDTINRDYTGMSPFSAGQIGLGADVLKGIMGQVVPQQMAFARGEGGAGFDPRLRETLKNEFLADIEAQQARETRQLTGRQASAGLRGSIPYFAQQELDRQIGRRRASGLADIDIAHLQGLREDRNKALFQGLPGLVKQGTDTQYQRAAHDLDVFRATTPLMIPRKNPFEEALKIGAAAFGLGGGFGGGGGLGLPINQFAMPGSVGPANTSIYRTLGDQITMGGIGRPQPRTPFSLGTLSWT